MFVIQNTETGAYMARPGSARSYVRNLQDARVFSDAEPHRCGNERVLSVGDALGMGDRFVCVTVR